MRRLFPILLILVAAEGGGAPLDREVPRRHHYLLTAQHTLRPNEQAALEAQGIEIQHVLPGARYVVRAASIDDVADDPRVASIAPIDPIRKIAASAYHAAVSGHAFTRVRLIFHDDVSFADAQTALARVGGTVDAPLADDFALPHRLVARIPASSLAELASDDSVFAVYGPPLRIAPTNSSAAALSHVTPLYSAPYNLSGAGVVVSEFEFASPDVTHPEFGGRVTNHINTAGDSGTQLHATHVAGTILAAGNLSTLQSAGAKGMAPAAQLHAFDANLDWSVIMSTKQNQLAPLGIIADNNSWGFQIGWQNGGSGWVWYGSLDAYGAYDGFYAAPYDKVVRTTPVLFMHSAGNDGANGNFAGNLTPPWYPHSHVNDQTGDVIPNETFCFTQNGSGTDCPVPCTQTPGHCEAPHPVYGPFTTIGPTGSLKDVIVVGATNGEGLIAGFSSRGPTLDGRVKPDLVAQGQSQLSTAPGGFYANESGTSMSSPVVTGISADMTELWRKTFGGANPLPVQLKAVLIAGADDLGNPGPDYTYGFGLANAQASADLIIADNNTGSRMRLGDIAQGQGIEIPLTISAPQKLRVVLAWPDPEVLLGPDDVADKTLVNNLDLKVVDAAGNATLPYVLDKSNPNANATTGVNSVDNVEEVEIANAAAGSYKIVITGTSIATGPSQQYAVVANAQMSAPIAPCSDSFEPNDTEATAFGFLVNRETINASLCTATDLDFYRIKTSATGGLSINVTTADTPLRVTISGNGITPVVTTVNPGPAQAIVLASAPAGVYVVKVEPAGALGATKAYTLTPTFATTPPSRRRATRH